MPPRRPISRAPSGQHTTTGTPSTRTLPPSDTGSPTPSVVGEAQPSRRYRFLKKRTPAPDMPPPPVPPLLSPVKTVGAPATVNEARDALPPPPPHARPLSFLPMRTATPKPDEPRVMSVEVPTTAAVPDDLREATGSEMAPNPVEERERVPEPPLAASDAAPSRDEPRVTTGHAVVRSPGESRGIIDPDTASVPDSSQPSAGHEALAVPGEPQEAIASQPSHVPGESRETAAPEVSNVSGELRDVVAPQKSYDPGEVQETEAPDVSNISGEFRDTAAPQPSPVPGESRETAAPEVSYASNELRDTAAPEAAHIPDKPLAAEGSDSGDKMETDSVGKDEDAMNPAMSQAMSGRFTIEYSTRAPYPEVQSDRHFTAAHRGLLMLDPSDHMGDLIERCTLLMGAVLDLHDDLSYIRDGLFRSKRLNEQKE
ncbi:hypothetical protein EDB85DRAFT_2156849 [Lactarius pseudohatsudake]|nr:hypothetical protein EDB85DRAFT_2156849 [Lactarius pseudohatsudake]